MYPGVLNRYLFKSISMGILMAALMFLTLDVLISFIQQVNQVGKGDFTVGSAFYYTLLVIPSSIYNVFPVSAVVGVMLGLGLLSANSELVIVQSIGISKLKLASITIVTLVAWLVPISLLGEFVAADAKLLAESYRSTTISKNIGLGANTGVWIRDNNVIFNAVPTGNTYDIRNKDIVMNDVTVYELDESLQVEKVSKAKQAIHKQGSWELFDIEVTEFVELGVETKKYEKLSWPSRIEPEILSITHSRPKNLSIRDIIKFKKFHVDENKIPANYEIALWTKFFYPLVVISTALTALPFLFGLMRAGGFGQRLLTGILLGVVLDLSHRTLLNIGEVYNVHPTLVTVVPQSLILIMVLLYLKTQNQK